MTNTTPPDPPMPFWLTPEYIAEKARKRALRDRFGSGKQGREAHRKYVLKIVFKLKARGKTHKVIAAHLNAIACPRIGRLLPWVASSIARLLKEEAQARQKAAERSRRYAESPKGQAWAAITLRDDIQINND